MTEGQVITEARKANALTQAQLATKLGFGTTQFISNIERNKAKLPPAYLKKLVKIVGIRIVKELIDLRANEYRGELLKELN